MKRELKSFTLVELLIALSILSIITYMSASSFVSIRKATEWSGQNAEIRKKVYTLVDNLNNELSSVIYISSNRRTTFKSVRTNEAGVEINNLRFCFISPISFYELAKRDELVEVEYTVKQDEKSVNKYMVNKRIWYYARFPDKPEQRDPDASYTLITNVDFFRLRFYSRGKWYDSWDTDKIKDIPEMIELDFSLNSKEYREYFNVYISKF